MKSTGLTAVFTLVLKIFAVASLVVGFGFIIFGCILESPPKNFTPVALVLVGVLSIIGSGLGWFGARFQPRLLAAYLVVGSVASVLQLIILLTIFFAQEKIATTITNAEHLKEADRKYIVSKLEAGKWLFLWVVLAELVGMAFACVMLAMGKLEGRYANMEQSEIDAEHNAELSNMYKSVNASHSNRGDNRLAAKMQAKYGASSSEDFMAGRRWYNIFR